MACAIADEEVGRRWVLTLAGIRTAGVAAADCVVAAAAEDGVAAVAADQRVAEHGVGAVDGVVSATAVDEVPKQGNPIIVGEHRVRSTTEVEGPLQPGLRPVLHGL